MAGLPYDPVELETRWQARWDRDPPPAPTGETFYNLVEFPYPSAEGLHVGHALSYCGADVVGRYQRMRGRAVFQPMGFDSFGIHTENYALKVGEHPAALTARTVANYRRQLSRLGCAWDWTGVVTSDPSYYRWTQWLFLRLFEAGLAHQAEAPVVWCPSCATVLAHEQLEDGQCERCGSPVTERVMRQWFPRITAYRDRLAAGLEKARLARAGQEHPTPVAGGHARLADLPPALLGTTHPDHPLRAVWRGPGPGGRASASAARGRHRRRAPDRRRPVAARRHRVVRDDDLPGLRQAGAAGDRRL